MENYEEMTRAERAAEKAYPPCVVKTMYGEEDSNAFARLLFWRGYQHAEQDLALTAEDVGCIYNLVLQMRGNNNATSACYQKVADIFNKDRESDTLQKSEGEQ